MLCRVAFIPVCPKQLIANRSIERALGTLSSIPFISEPNIKPSFTSA